jgi:hypothetical protein
MTRKTGKQRSKTGVTAAEFRRLALSLPETEEKAHMNHPDFRVRGKVFATLQYPDKNFGMVKLSPETQAMFVAEDPSAFQPCAGAWGLQGATNVRLAAIHPASLEKGVTENDALVLSEPSAVADGSDSSTRGPIRYRGRF